MRSSLIAGVRRSPDILISVVLLILIYVVGVVGIPGFGGEQTFKAVLLLASFLGIAAAGQTLVVILGGIDLSIPFVVGAANVAVAKLYGDGMPFLLATLISLIVAGLFGVANAAISVKSNVHPLIVTLGMGTALLGAVSLWTNGLPSGGSPAWLTQFVAIGSTTGPIPVPPVIFLWLLISVGMVVLLRASIFGRKLYALGNSPQAAELALVRRLPVWAVSFGASSVLSAVAGVLFLGFTGAAFAGVGQPYLFLTVGAVVLGGTLITGGRGGYVGTIVGALTITLLTIVLTGFGLNASLQQVVMGTVFVGIVAAYGRDAHVRSRV
ncbi:ABC transporter permease [Glaciihabitans sp. UYNi722]|uniref:ABC transporter permease n=1 Tax=Glaciihabitans sp. UYNi722 TaxID=3156344 RepID=UPI00339ADFA1